MVIQCPECSTRFRVATEKIPAQGARVRCARCKHIFAVKPHADIAEPEESISFTPPTPPQEQQPSQAEDSAGVDSADEPPVSDQIFPESAATEDEASDEDDSFGFDDFDSQPDQETGTGTQDDFDAASFGEDEDEEEETFSFSEDYGNVQLGEGEEDEDEDEGFAFGEDSSDAPGDFTFSEEPEQGLQPDPVLKAAVDELSNDEVAAGFEEDPFVDPQQFHAEEESFEPMEDDEQEEVKEIVSEVKKRSPLSVVIMIVLMLVLAILVAGGLMVWQNGPEALEQTINKLMGKEVEPAVKGQIRLDKLDGTFITNPKAGELFVIQGEAINDFQDARAAIQVKGVIFDKGGKQLLQKTIFCGNPIEEKDLKRLPYDKLEEMMSNQFGASLANLNVGHGQKIPFTIVFRNLPKTLSEFIVEVADSKPVAQ